MTAEADTGSAEKSGTSPIEAGTRGTCVCGGDIEWRVRPMLPFPEVASERQLARQGTGRWVHVHSSGTDEEASWCTPQQARPAVKGPSDRAVLLIQKGLLDMQNYAVGLRGGWVDTHDEDGWQKTRESFGLADALLRKWLTKGTFDE